MSRRLAAEPIPDHWFGEQLSNGTNNAVSGGTDLWQHVVRFYHHFQSDEHHSAENQVHNWKYLEGAHPDQRPLLDRRYSTSINIAVPDPVREPHQWRRIDSGPLPPGVILNVLRDGHRRLFYLHRSQRVYLLRDP